MLSRLADVSNLIDLLFFKLLTLLLFILCHRYLCWFDAIDTVAVFDAIDTVAVFDAFNTVFILMLLTLLMFLIRLTLLLLML